MPRVVRNFFTRLDVDGRKTKIDTGPRSGSGGFDQTIYMRNDGQVDDETIEIRGFVNSQGLLVLRIMVGDNIIYERKTVR